MIAFTSHKCDSAMCCVCFFSSSIFSHSTLHAIILILCVEGTKKSFSSHLCALLQAHAQHTLFFRSFSFIFIKCMYLVTGNSFLRWVFHRVASPIFNFNIWIYIYIFRLTESFRVQWNIISISIVHRDRRTKNGWMTKEKTRRIKLECVWKRQRETR